MGLVAPDDRSGAGPGRAPGETPRSTDAPASAAARRLLGGIVMRRPPGFRVAIRFLLASVAVLSACAGGGAPAPEASRSRSIEGAAGTTTPGGGGTPAGGGPQGTGGGTTTIGGLAGAGGAVGAGGAAGGAGAPEPPAAWLSEGTVLVTTADLNLREGPGTDTAIVTVMPPDSHVVVVDDGSAAPWAHVRYRFGGQVGYAHADYLAAPPPPVDPGYADERAEVLAKKAVELWSGAGSGDMCLYGVDQSVKGSGILPDAGAWPTLPSAVAWGDWASSHPAEMKSFGFVPIDLAPDELPQGSIIVWQPGQCGYHAVYGHIEVVVDMASSRACSDFCGDVRHDCGHPLTWIPVAVP